ncbi:MAG: SDR family NAD(P)-dependent oxidoreductase [Chloroflexota bacterium]|nr:SDR family NAD(P)-dependent oxidoreductase [Chloroflexota bacterium]
MSDAIGQALHARYGPWAVVAGASAGLGAAYATRLAEAGFGLALVARRAPELEALAATLAERYGVATRTLPLDLGQPDAAATIDARTSDLDVGLLVYNAARAPVGAFLDLPLEEHLAELAVNTRTPMELTWRFGRRFRARGRGGLLLMSSLGANQGTALAANYGATKAWALTLAEGLWEEWRKLGLDALAVQPAVIAGAGARAGGTTVTPDAVAVAGLAALGHGPSVTPGAMARLASLFMRRALPRTSAIRMMGRVMRRMYGGAPPRG